MGIIENGHRLVQYVDQMIKVGANQAQNTNKPQADIGIFTKGYPEWVADGGIEEIGHISVYKGVAYRCGVQSQRIEVFTPDVATNNYNPYPEPDMNGVFPYVYGMGIKKDMLVKYDDITYRCILNTGENDYKLIYKPYEVPALFDIVE